jgi:hypothetical protein
MKKLGTMFALCLALIGCSDEDRCDLVAATPLQGENLQDILNAPISLAGADGMIVNTLAFLSHLSTQLRLSGIPIDAGGIRVQRDTVTTISWSTVVVEFKNSKGVATPPVVSGAWLLISGKVYAIELSEFQATTVLRDDNRTPAIAASKACFESALNGNVEAVVLEIPAGNGAKVFLKSSSIQYSKDG